MDRDLSVFGQGGASMQFIYEPPQRPVPPKCPSCGAVLGTAMELGPGKTFAVTISHPGPVCSGWPDAFRRLYYPIEDAGAKS